MDVGVNGVVRSLTHTHEELTARGHTISMLTPEKFKTFSCTTYPEIRLSFSREAMLQKSSATISLMSFT